MFHAKFANAFDVHVFHLINGLAGHNHVLDAIMVFFAKDALEIYAVLFLLFWFLLPKADIRSRHTLLVAGLSGVLALIINVLIAHVWFRPRPFVALQKGTVTQLVPHSQDASFPSDHVSGSFGFASASWGRSTKLISYAFTILAVIVMFARVYVGVHYPTDVLAGMVVGVISSLVMWRFSGVLYKVTSVLTRLFGYGAARVHSNSSESGGRMEG